MKTAIEVATTPWRWQAMHDADGLCRQAEQAEALGFHSFWLPENHFGEHSAIPAPLMSLAAVAARTSRIRLGCTSYLLPIRDPVLAAEEVAVLDHLCGGRLILGLGRGTQAAVFEAFNIEASDKRRLFREKLEMMRSAWRGEAIVQDKAGAPVRLSPVPLQQPSPPLWVAAFGPLALKQVAALGLPYLASPLETLDELDANYRSLGRHARDAGHTPQETVPVMRSVFVCDRAVDAERVKDVMRAMLPPRIRNNVSSMNDRVLVGDASYVRDSLQAYRERLGLTHLIVRAGGRGIGEQQQLKSHERLLVIASDCT